MSRNFGVGTRDLLRAGEMFVHQSELSFSSKATIKMRWRKFCAFAKFHGIRKLEQINKSFLVCYGQSLQVQIEKNTLSPATAQNYVSAVNTVLNIATNNQWESVRPTFDCHIDRRQRIAQTNKATSLAMHLKTQAAVSERLSVLLGLQRTLGLRFKESVLLDARAALKSSKRNNKIIISRGTKGGRKRQVPVTQEARHVLTKAAQLQDGVSMIPDNLNYHQFQTRCYQEMINHPCHFHGERHFYAQKRYKEITGAPAPIAANWLRKERLQKLAAYLSVDVEKASEIDQYARLQIARELGHGREEVTNAYLG